MKSTKERALEFYTDQLRKEKYLQNYGVDWETEKEKPKLQEVQK